MFHTWQCTAVNIKQWDNGHETIDRRNNLSYEDFAKEYLEPNKPVVITDVIDKWPGICKYLQFAFSVELLTLYYQSKNGQNRV